jgi:hypothetical protein
MYSESWCGAPPRCGRCGCEVEPHRKLCDTCKPIAEVQSPWVNNAFSQRLLVELNGRLSELVALLKEKNDE